MEILFCLWTRIAFAISGEWCLLWLRTFLASDFQLVNPSLGLQYGLWIVNTQISVCNTSFFSSDKESPEKFVCKQNSTTNFGRFDGNYQLAPICRPFGKKKSNLHGFVLQRFHLFHIFSIKWRNKTALHENVEENSLERERSTRRVSVHVWRRLKANKKTKFRVRNGRSRRLWSGIGSDNGWERRNDYQPHRQWKKKIHGGRESKKGEVCWACWAEKEKEEDCVLVSNFEIYPSTKGLLAWTPRNRFLIFSCNN